MTQDADDGARTHVVDDSWDDSNEILEGLREGDNNPLEDYDHFDNATDLINYVEEELATDQETVARAQEYFANAKCPDCEAHNREIAISGDVDDQRLDPTLEKYVWTDEEDSDMVGADTKHTAYFAAKCGNNHEDSFMLYEESWHE